MPKYISRCVEAINFSKSHKIFIPNPITFSTGTYLSNIDRSLLLNALCDVFENPAYGLVDKSSLKQYNFFKQQADRQFQCMPVHAYGLEGIAQLLKTTPFFTIGYARHIITGNLHYETSEEELTHLLVTKSPSPQLHLHSWLTLHTGEIIDFTLSPSLNAEKQPQPYAKNLPEVITGPGDAANGFEYVPVAAGRDWLFKAGIFQFY